MLNRRPKGDQNPMFYEAKGDFSIKFNVLAQPEPGRFIFGYILNFGIFSPAVAGQTFWPEPSQTGFLSLTLLVPYILNISLRIV